ncbi:hypothetical protein V6Z11_A11G109700 [Gossypium hirsutum]
MGKLILQLRPIHAKNHALPASLVSSSFPRMCQQVKKSEHSTHILTSSHLMHSDCLLTVYLLTTIRSY